jgi:hypothetical protein
MGYYYENGYPPYVPVAERRAKGQRKLNQMRKKNSNLSPIMVEGRVLMALSVVDGIKHGVPAD